MSFKLNFSERSEEDAKLALYYYNQISPDLGKRFLNELIDTYKKLSVSPQYFSFISTSKKTNLRDVKLRSFPFVVIFEIQGNIVSVIAVLNTNKNPLIS